MTRSAKARVLAALAVTVILMPTTASANAGIPMIVLVWPGFWILFVPVVGLEALVARRVLQIDWSTALRVSAKANVASTLVGIPLTWLIMLMVEALAAAGLWYGSRAVGLTEPPDWFGYAMLPFSAPWVGGDEPWVVPAAAAWLGVFFFLASVWIEQRVAVRNAMPPLDARRWSWQANILSYGAIEVLMLSLLGWTLLVKS